MTSAVGLGYSCSLASKTFPLDSALEPFNASSAVARSAVGTQDGGDGVEVVLARSAGAGEDLLLSTVAPALLFDRRIRASSLPLSPRVGQMQVASFLPRSWAAREGIAG